MVLMLQKSGFYALVAVEKRKQQTTLSQIG
jgi:hypothetical protein